MVGATKTQESTLEAADNDRETNLLQRVALPAQHTTSRPDPMCSARRSGSVEGSWNRSGRDVGRSAPHDGRRRATSGARGRHADRQSSGPLVRMASVPPRDSRLDAAAVAGRGARGGLERETGFEPVAVRLGRRCGHLGDAAPRSVHDVGIVMVSVGVRRPIISVEPVRRYWRLGPPRPAVRERVEPPGAGGVGPVPTRPGACVASSRRVRRRRRSRHRRRRPGRSSAAGSRSGRR